MPSLSLRAKFLLALVLISGLITTGVLLLVRARVEVRARADLAQGLGASVTAFNALQAQREQTLERSAALLAALAGSAAADVVGDDVRGLGLAGGVTVVAGAEPPREITCACSLPAVCCPPAGGGERGLPAAGHRSAGGGGRMIPGPRGSRRSGAWRARPARRSTRAPGGC